MFDTMTMTKTVGAVCGSLLVLLLVGWASDSLYTVGGSTTAITLTRIAARHNDSTLNISLDNGTCTGITPALTSANTTAGINPAKCWRISGTTYAGDDFEGIDFADVDDFQGFQIRHTAGTGNFTIDATTAAFSDQLGPNEVCQKFSATSGDMVSIFPADTLTFTGTANYCKAIVTFIFD